MYCNCFLPTENNSITGSSINNRSRTTAPTKVYLYPYSVLKRSRCSIITNKLRKNYNLSHFCFKKELIRVCMQSTTFDNVQYLWNSFQNKRNEYLFCCRSFFPTNYRFCWYRVVAVVIFVLWRHSKAVSVEFMATTLDTIWKILNRMRERTWICAHYCFTTNFDFNLYAQFRHNTQFVVRTLHRENGPFAW